MTFLLRPLVAAIACISVVSACPRSQLGIMRQGLQNGSMQAANRGGHQSAGMAGPQYQAYVANGNGADMLRACLEARGCWKLLRAEDGDDTTAWNLWWGNNGQQCPFKRLRTSALPPHPNDHQLLPPTMLLPAAVLPVGWGIMHCNAALALMCRL